ncbi:MAG: carboxypeptidase regulatory-like domain-containing protein [Acidobacteriota bacterium]
MKRTIAISLSTLLLVVNLFGLVAPGAAYAQALIELRGTVVDETNAYIAAAPLTLDDGKGQKYTAVADDRGRYRFTVKPGVYTLTVEVEGFGQFSEQLDLTSKPSGPFDVKLKITLAEQVEVKDQAAQISTDPDKNLSAITLTEKDLEALPDDPDELLETLKQMAGAAGADASVFVGGFRERGQIPPKEAILRININSNPFSAEHTETGFGRIEIITKPGVDTYHGGFNLNFNDESLNARNPYASFRAPLQTRRYGGYFSGPIVRNRAGFFFDFSRNETDENDVVNAIVLNPTTLQPQPFLTTFLTPVRGFNFSVRTDVLLTKKHTIGFQYRHSENERLSLGGNGFSLPQRATTTKSSEDTLRFSLTTIASEHAVNEMRIQLGRRPSRSRGLSNDIAVNVLDAFSSGGSQSFSDNLNRNLDFANILTYTYKKHTFKTGFTAEANQYENLNRSNFNGTFTFSSLDQFAAVLRGDAGARPSQFSTNRGDPFIGFTQWEYGTFFQDDWKVSPKLTLSFGLRQDFQTHLQDKINISPRFGFVWAVDKKSNIRGGGGVFYNRLDTGITSDVTRFDGGHQQQFVIQRPNFFRDIPNVFDLAAQVQTTTRIKAEDLNAPYTIQGSISYERQLPKNLFASVSYDWFRGVHLLRLRNINAPLGFENGQPIFPFPEQGPTLQYESTGFSRRQSMRVGLRANINQKINLFSFYTLASAHSDTDGSGTTPANPYDLSTEYGRAGSDSRHQFILAGNFTLPGEIRLTPHINLRTGGPFNITTGRDNNGDNQFSDRPAFASPGDPGAIVTRFGAFNPNPQFGDEIIPRNFGQGPGSISVNLGISRTFGFGPPPNNFPGMGANRAGPQTTQGQQQGGRQAQNQRGGGRGDNSGGSNAGAQGRGGQAAGGARGGSNAGAQGRGGQGGAGGPTMISGGGGQVMMMGGPGFGGNRHKYNLTVSINANNVLNHVNEGRFNGTLTSPFFGRSNSFGGGGGGGPFGSGGGARRIELTMRFNF